MSYVKKELVEPFPVVDVTATMYVRGELVGAIQRSTRPYRDSVTGEDLDEEQTLEGMRLEFRTLADFDVFVPATRQQAEDAGKQIAGTQWTFRKKDDQVKARVVIQEPGSEENQSVFIAASTALATRFVLWWTLRNPDFVCATFDVLTVFAQLPAEESAFCECPIGFPVASKRQLGEIFQILKMPCSSRTFEILLKKYKVRCLKSETSLFSA